MADDTNQQAAAIEHLCGYIDLVLEAFHTGEGLVNNAPEPITIDVARRLIWFEVRRVIGSLYTDDCSLLPWCLWLRIQPPENVRFQDVYEVLNNAPGVDHWSYRVFGPRKAGDPTVIYALADLDDTKAAVLPYLWEKLPAGTTIRDIQLGVRT